METWKWLVAVAAALALVYVYVHRHAARARTPRGRASDRCFVPDCTVLFARLVRQPGLPRARWLVLGLVTAYLAMPFDLVPDFLPGIGYLDDALVVVLTLRWIIRAAGRESVEAHWPGLRSSLSALLRVAGAGGR